MTGHLCAGVIASSRCEEISVSSRHALFDITNTMEHLERLIMRRSPAAFPGPPPAGSERGILRCPTALREPCSLRGRAPPPQSVLTSDGSGVGVPNLRADHRALLSGLTASAVAIHCSLPDGLSPLRSPHKLSPGEQVAVVRVAWLLSSTPSGGRALPAARPNK